jgi:hypothetical protein
VVYKNGRNRDYYKLNVSDEVWDDVKARILNGETVSQIVKIYPDITAVSIYGRNKRKWHLKLHKSRTRQGKRKFTLQQELEILDKYKNQLYTAKSLSEEYSCNISTIERIVRRNQAVKDSHRKKMPTGDKHHGWQGGKSIFTKSGYRFSDEYKSWRLSVFT